MQTSTQLFVASTLIQASGAAFYAYWPFHLQGISPTFAVARASYSLANSNLDVCFLTCINVIVLLTLLWIISFTKAPRRGTSFRGKGDPHRRGTVALSLWSSIFQLSLLAKAVIVAIIGSEEVFPTHQDNKGHKPVPAKSIDASGLLFIYASLLTSLVTSFIQTPSAKAIIKRWRRRVYSIATTATDNNSTTTTATTPLLPPVIDGVGGGQHKPIEHDDTDSVMGGEEEGEEEGEHAAVDGETRRATIGVLLNLSFPDAPILLLAFSAGAIAALGQALVPFYTGHIIDYASIDPDPEAFKRTTIKLLGVALGCALFTGIRGGLFTISMTRLNVRLRRTLFASLMRQDMSFFDSTKTGQITSRLAADTSTVSDQISLNLNVMLRSATQAAMVLAFMFTASWRLTVVTFVLVPIVLAICKVYGNYYRKMSKRVQSELAEANSVAEEALGTMATVKAHAAEGSTQVAYAEKLMRFYSLQRNEAFAYAIYMTTNTFLSAAVVAGVLFYGGTMVLDHCMSAGALVSFMLYQQSLTGAFQQLGDVFSALSAAGGAADKVVELMHRRPAISAPGTLAPPEFTGRIELRDITFAYPSRPDSIVLSNFSLTVHPGEVVALVGPSGGGKSSIVKLVERFYVPTLGGVTIDGRDVAEYESGWLRRHVALVSQEPVLYARSIRRNIIYGLEPDDGVPPCEQPTQEDIEDAAKLANAHEFIMSLPQGYDTEIMGAPSLSGGQKQRLAIARALVRRPAVLLLDEATSALDADSEAVVQEALDRTMSGRTVLVIAHRLSTVQGASRIVVVQGGGVAEQGTHDELLARGGAYAALVKRQLTRSASSSSVAAAATLAAQRTSSFIAMNQ